MLVGFMAVDLGFSVTLVHHSSEHWRGTRCEAEHATSARTCPPASKCVGGLAGRRRP